MKANRVLKVNKSRLPGYKKLLPTKITVVIRRHLGMLVLWETLWYENKLSEQNNMPRWPWGAEQFWIIDSWLYAI